VARIGWGLVGPGPARFASFVRGPREVLRYAGELLRGRPTPHLSHNPLGGAMVVALVGVLLAIAVTGAVVYAGPHFEGPLTGLLTKRDAKAVKEIHEAFSNVLLGLVGVHVAGVLASSRLERQNLVLGMITGRKRVPLGALPAASSRKGVLARLGGAATVVVLGAAAALGLALLLGLPRHAHAATPLPAELLREWEAVARRERPGFQGFSAAEGRRIYVAEHVQDGATVSCASCHTADPRRSGRTPVGKVVDPLAPAANPDRFTDRREVEKWFKRNCKQVMGRECTAEEKGHFLAYVLAP
jgi:cytochrome b